MNTKIYNITMQFLKKTGLFPDLTDKTIKEWEGQFVGINPIYLFTAAERIYLETLETNEIRSFRNFPSLLKAKALGIEREMGSYLFLDTEKTYEGRLICPNGCGFPVGCCNCR